MNDKTIARVDRLVRYVERHQKELLEEGKVSPSLLATRTGKTQAYWSDVLRCRTSGKSFGDKAARDVEQRLEMPHLYLDGGSDWPFSEVDQARYERLTAVQKGRVQQAMLQVLDEIERSQGATAGRAATLSRVDTSDTDRKAEVDPRKLEDLIGGLFEMAGQPRKKARAAGRKLTLELTAPRPPSSEPSSPGQQVPQPSATPRPSETSE